jgi:TRAP-type C4-dicarboxylate transport system permease small subunit
MLRTLTLFDRVTAVLACGIVTAILTTVALGVVTRALGDPFIWTDELSRFLMVWLAVFGWIIATRKRIHVRIRFFQDRLPPRLHRTVEIVIQLAMTIFGALVAAYGVGLVGKNHDLEATSLPISMSWLYAPLVLGGIATALQGLAEVIQAVSTTRSTASAE